MRTIVMIPVDSVAMRFVRLLPSGEIREYEPVTFDKPFDACVRWLNRCRAIGHLAARQSDAYGQAEMIDREGDVLAEVPLTKDGFQYWKTKMKCRVAVPGEQ